MHNLCMPTKTISLRLEAYDRLRRARRYLDESFSDVVLRAQWPEDTLTGDELLARYREHGPFFDERTLQEVERALTADAVPEDKWSAGSS